jgi:hypothetical protein
VGQPQAEPLVRRVQAEPLARLERQENRAPAGVRGRPGPTDVRVVICASMGQIGPALGAH